MCPGVSGFSRRTLRSANIGFGLWPNRNLCCCHAVLHHCFGANSFRHSVTISSKRAGLPDPFQNRRVREPVAYYAGGGSIHCPLLLLSAFGGEMADRYDKATVAQSLKFVEIGVAMLAVAGFAMHSVANSVRGAIRFWRHRFAVRPDQVRHPARPPAALGIAGRNAFVEGATFMAILLGTIVGGLAAKDGGNPASFAGLMLVFALLSWTSALFIPRVGFRVRRTAIRNRTS